MNNIAFATIKELRQLLDTKKITAYELLDYTLKRFEKFDSELGSALELFDKESVMACASHDGALAGIPCLAKDIIAQRGRRLTCASRILSGFVSAIDATAVSRLKEAGSLLIGRANCDEFAMGSSNETSAYKVVRNPWDHTRVPGGSSGGSIAAVAAGLVPYALGTETGGSVRQPAALCGIVGSKPTYGLISRYGVVAYASSFDQIGVATRSVYDNALVFSVIAGHDAKDSSTLNVDQKDYTGTLDGALTQGLTIGVLEDALHAEGVDPEVIRAIECAVAELEKLGAKIKRVSLPVLEYGIAAYVILSRAEAASNLSKFDGVRYGARVLGAQTLEDMYCKTRHRGFGSEVRRRILAGNYVLSAGHAAEFYDNAKKVQNLIRQGFLDLFKDVDILAMPVTPTAAFKIGGITSPLQMDLQDYFTCPINVAGIPAISIPCGFTRDSLPIGFQLVGPHLSEELLFKTAYAYEQATSWHTMHPQGY
jgi:aspartyl-tRNA(Asn)/glutamyl-tRNA(Gln) amidotransferase subunit A